jgi:hypothetical protein
MRLIEESGFDAGTKGQLAMACEVALRHVVRDQPRQAWNARLLSVIQHAVLDCAALGERDHERLVSYAELNARELLTCSSRKAG